MKQSFQVAHRWLVLIFLICLGGCSGAKPVPDSMRDRIIFLSDERKSYVRIHRDLTKLLASPSLQEPYRAAALLGRGRALKRWGQLAAAQADFTELLKLTGANPEDHKNALLERGLLSVLLAQPEAAQADCATLLARGDLTAGERAKVAVFRGGLRAGGQAAAEADADWAAALATPGLTTDETASLYRLRAEIWLGPIEEDPNSVFHLSVFANFDRSPGEPVFLIPPSSRLLKAEGQQNREKAITELTRALLVADISNEMRAHVLLNRALLLYSGNAGTEALACADYSTVIALTNVSDGLYVQARLKRGWVLFGVGEIQAAIEDFTFVEQMPGATPDEQAIALCARALCHDRRLDDTKVLADIAAGLSQPDLVPELSCQLLLLRLMFETASRNWKGSQATVQEILAIPGVSDENAAAALEFSARMHYQKEENATALDVLERLFALPSVSPGRRATAQHLQACVRQDLGESAKALVEFTALIEGGLLSRANTCLARVRRGRLYVEAGEVEAGLADFTAVVTEVDPAQEPDSELVESCCRAYMNRGTLQDNLKRSDEALADLNKALACPGIDDDLRGQVINNLAYCRMRRQETAEALDALAEALKLPGLETNIRHGCLVLRGRGYTEQKKYREARADFNTVLNATDSSDSSKLAALRGRSDLSREENRLDEAKADLEQLLANKSLSAYDTLQTRLRLIMVSEQTGDVPQALFLYGKLIEDPATPEELRAQYRIRRASVFAQNRFIREAEIELTNAAGQAGITVETRAEAHRSLAVLAMNEGKPDLAVVHLSTALKLTNLPTKVQIQCQLMRGQAYSRQQMITEAVADIDAVLANAATSKEDLCEAHQSRAGLYMAAGEDAKAMDEIQAAMDAAQSEAQRIECIGKRASLNGDCKRYKEGIADYSAVIASPDAPKEKKRGALFYRGYYHGLLGEFDAAAADLELLRDDPQITGADHWTVSDTLFKVYLQQRNFKGAAAEAVKFIAEHPKDYTHHFLAGLALLMEGQRDEAAKHYQAGMKLCGTKNDGWKQAEVDLHWAREQFPEHEEDIDAMLQQLKTAEPKAP